MTLIKCISIFALPNYLPTYIMAAKLKNHYSSLQVTAFAFKIKDFVLNEGHCANYHPLFYLFGFFLRHLAYPLTTPTSSLQILIDGSML